MKEKGMTIVKAAREWVQEFNAIPRDMIELLMRTDPYSWSTITKPYVGARVYVEDGEHDGEEGEIIECNYDGEPDLYVIKLDNEDLDDIVLAEDEFYVIYETEPLPMWGTMWSFGNSVDDHWLENEDHLRLMSQCGFRIYYHSEWGYFFGIDGAGYDFYEAHWIPLYKARGLKWHDEVAEEEYQMKRKGYVQKKLGAKLYWMDGDTVIKEVQAQDEGDSR